MPSVLTHKRRMPLSAGHTVSSLCSWEEEERLVEDNGKDLRRNKADGTVLGFSDSSQRTGMPGVAGNVCLSHLPQADPHT